MSADDLLYWRVGCITVSEDRLREHTVVLQGTTSMGRPVRLRPMTENDWDILLQWNSDPEVLYFSEGDDVSSWSLEEVQMIYRSVSQKAFCFIIESEAKPIGEGWLQEMNQERILKRYPGLDLRRIDLMIGDKSRWGQGFGTATIRLLTSFGFEEEGADVIFGCGIADYNPRSLRAFMRVGYQIVFTELQKPGGKARYSQDVAITREMWFNPHNEAWRLEQESRVLPALAVSSGVLLRPFRREDYPVIQSLCDKEGWMTLAGQPNKGLQAWMNSWPALVAVKNGEIIGFLRALSDAHVSTYVAELLVAKDHRGSGIGRLLLEACHHLCPATRLDLLSTESAHEFYRHSGFRAFAGFRKSHL